MCIVCIMCDWILTCISFYTLLYVAYMCTICITMSRILIYDWVCFRRHMQEIYRSRVSYMSDAEEEEG